MAAWHALFFSACGSGRGGTGGSFFLGGIGGVGRLPPPPALPLPLPPAFFSPSPPADCSELALLLSWPALPPAAFPAPPYSPLFRLAFAARSRALWRKPS